MKALIERCARREDGSDYYERLRLAGIEYGTAFRVIREIYTGEGVAASRLEVADSTRPGFDQYLLHPCIIDGAFQTIGALAGDLEPGQSYVPFSLDRIEIADRLRHCCYACVRPADAGIQVSESARNVSIDLVSESGDTLVRMVNFCVRPFMHGDAHARTDARMGMEIQVVNGLAADRRPAAAG